MIGAWFYYVLVNTMLLLLLSPSDNARCMDLSSIGKYHPLTGLSPTDNARSMVLSRNGKYHALAVVITY